MQYLVYSSGRVIENQKKAYVIQAKSEAEAQEIAKENFCEEFCVADTEIYTKPHKRIVRAIWAYIFMIVPIGLSFITWKSGHDTIHINPDYISCLYAVFFYVAYIIRFKGIQRTVSSWIDIGFCIEITLLLATFIRTILITETFEFFDLIKIPIDTGIVLPVAMLLSWLGMKLVSVISVIGITVIALINVYKLSEAMGIWGPIYIMGAFLGILFYFSVEPIFLEGMSNFGKSVGSGLRYIKNDFKEAGQSAKKMGNSAFKYTKDKGIEKKEKTDEL